MIWPPSATIGDLYGPAMSIGSQERANTYFLDLVDWHMSYGNRGLEEASKLVRDNLAYYAGYYDNETRRRVERFFECAHPIFGAIAEKGPPTAQQAIEAVADLARRIGP